MNSAGRHLVVQRFFFCSPSSVRPLSIHRNTLQSVRLTGSWNHIERTRNLPLLGGPDGSGRVLNRQLEGHILALRISACVIVDWMARRRSLPLSDPSVFGKGVTKRIKIRPLREIIIGSVPSSQNQFFISSFILHQHHSSDCRDMGFFFSLLHKLDDMRVMQKPQEISPGASS